VIEVLTDDRLAGRLVQAGLERAAAFTWERTAEGTVESYERAADERLRA
jgi:hypothetical protein